ncbi:hypothetical protein OJ253_2100 [Cryptosporidium canis]|uniref:TOG domain-containing protein n=1 Tax=Cryptosporidium canis TaxID=195482 RepID=A0A9D5DI55_9CRYT|nr:hypothetical protein OJ253_2100 [Cryptosporidium canis]
MNGDGDNFRIVLDGSSNFSKGECYFENGGEFCGIDASALPIDSLISSDEWQMRMCGYKRAIKELESINTCEFEGKFINAIINDKNISSQNLGIKFISTYIDNMGININSLPDIWRNKISDMLIKKTLFNHKTSASSINLTFTFFEQSLLLEKGDLTKVDYLWENMIDFINNNRKSKGITIKQIFGVVKLFSSFIDNYGVELSPIVKWSKALLPLVSECSDKNTKDCIYQILSVVNKESPLMDSISSLLTPLQLKEVTKRSVEYGDGKKEPIRYQFIDKIKDILDSNVRDSPIVVKYWDNSIDAFDLIEPVDVTKMLPSNWLEVISDKEIKWSERKIIIDQFCKLCEVHKKLPLHQNENKVVHPANKKTFVHTITDYQYLLNVLQRIIKCEGNTALILSVIRLCTNLVNCLRDKISAIIRPLTTQIMVKIKDQNKIVCADSIHFINVVLKHSLSLDQIFDDICLYGFREKVTTAKCSAITICNHLIDEIIEHKAPLDRHSKGIKQILNIVPSCFDDPSVQVRSSISVLIVKLKHSCFGDDINLALSKIILGLNNNKKKLINETEKKLGINLHIKSEEAAQEKRNTSITALAPIKNPKPPPNSTSTTPNNESAQLSRKSLSKIGLYKQSEVQNKNSFDAGRIEKSSITGRLIDAPLGSEIYKPDGSYTSSAKPPLSPVKAIGESCLHISESLPTILGSISSENDKKINFFERLSNNRTTDFKYIDGQEKQNLFYIDPTDSRNYVVKLPESEIIFETDGSDLSSLKTYIKPFVSENIFTSMFSNNKVQMDFSIFFWERFLNFLNESMHRFTLYYFFFKWISHNIEMRIAANYERILTVLFSIFLSQDKQYQQRYTESIIYNIFVLTVNIIIKELQTFDKLSILYSYEISKYERFIFLIMDKCPVSSNYLDCRVGQVHNQLNFAFLLMNMAIISSLRDLENFDSKVNLLNNHLNIIGGSSHFLKCYGVSNIYSLFEFLEQNSSNTIVCDTINNVLLQISNKIGVNLWNTMLLYFPDVKIDKYCISIDSGSSCSRLQSNLVIIVALIYETIKLFNTIGSTGDPTDLGIFLSSYSYFILKRILSNLYIVDNRLNCVLEDNRIESYIVENEIIRSLLIEHITYFSEISIHIYFLLTKLETFDDLELKRIIDPIKIGKLFFKAIEYLDIFTCKFQSIITVDEFPIKQMMMSTLFIMSDYSKWKERINDEVQKVKIVNSLNNIMGINIISSFQKELPRLIKIIIEVVLSGISPNKKTIFDIDLLNRLLPKVLRRMKAYLAKNNVEEFQIQIANSCMELINNPLVDKNSNELKIAIDFTLDYILLLLEGGISVQNEELKELNR